MGYLFRYNTSRTDVIRDVTADRETETTRKTCIARACRGNELWVVLQFEDKATGRVERELGCILLRSDGEGNWGYKSISELEGPCYYSCPLSYFEIVKEVNPQWRQQVRAHHAQRQQKTVPGERWALVPTASVRRVRILSNRPLRCVDLDSGLQYRLRRSLLSHRLPG